MYSRIIAPEVQSHAQAFIQRDQYVSKKLYLINSLWRRKKRCSKYVSTICITINTRDYFLNMIIAANYCVSYFCTFESKICIMDKREPKGSDTN